MRAMLLAMSVLLSMPPPAQGAGIGGSCRDGLPYLPDDAELSDAIRVSRSAGRREEAEALRVFAIAHRYYWRAESGCYTMTMLHPPTEAQERAWIRRSAARARATLLEHRELWRPMCKVLAGIVAKPTRDVSGAMGSALEAAVVLDGSGPPWCSPGVMAALAAGQEGDCALEVAKSECKDRREPHCARIARP